MSSTDPNDYLPRVGGLVDTARKAADLQSQQAGAVAAQAPVKKKIQPVVTKTKQPDLFGAKTLNISAGASIQAMPADKNRKRGMLNLITVTVPVTAVTVNQPALTTAGIYAQNLNQFSVFVTIAGAGTYTVYMAGVPIGTGPGIYLIAAGSSIGWNGGTGAPTSWSWAPAFGVTMPAEVLVSRDRSSADSGTGYGLFSTNPPLVIEHTREVWLNNPGSVAIQVSVFTESYAQD